MAGEHDEGAVSRRHFLRQSAMAAAALGAGSLFASGERQAVDAAGPLSPLQPPPDELLVTIKQVGSSGTIDVNNVTGALNHILEPAIGWRLRALGQANGQDVIVFNRHVAGSPTTTYTVIRYQNTNGQAQSHSALLAAGTILATMLVNPTPVLRQLPGGATLSVTPNWAITAAPGSFIQGGPGGLPAAAIPAAAAPCATGSTAWHFEFPTLPPAGALLKAPAGATVVVLDTAPALSSLDAAASTFSGNILLGAVVNQLKKPGHWQDALAPAPALGPVPPLLGAHLRPCKSSKAYQPYRMGDHGLFVAGIVHDIAPTCDLKLVRVLNQWGAGYLSDLLAALAWMPVAGPTVVNMSLTVRMPSIAELQQQLNSSPYPISLLGQMWGRLDDACAPLSDFLQLLAAGQVVTVAATGNDSGNGPLRDPCAPAAFDSTLGVAAVNHLQKRTCYSNKGDAQVAESDTVGNGIATFGGSGTPGGTVHGLYSAPDIYLPPKMAAPINSGGWAQWMGTSFASPVIAALAANYLANNPATSPSDVMKQIRKRGTMTAPELRVPTIPARQVQVCS